jgi:hypothetical protein
MSTQVVPSATPGTLKDWLTVEQLLERYGEHYKSPASLRWTLRVRRPELIKHQAISQVGARLLIHPARFEAAVIEGGIRTAEQRAA